MKIPFLGNIGKSKDSDAICDGLPLNENEVREIERLKGVIENRIIGLLENGEYSSKFLHIPYCTSMDVEVGPGKKEKILTLERIVINKYYYREDGPVSCPTMRQSAIYSFPKESLPTIYSDSGYIREGSADFIINERCEENLTVNQIKYLLGLMKEYSSNNALYIKFRQEPSQESDLSHQV